MEKEATEENEPNKHELIIKTPNWLDLPEPIPTNIILEHLELVDYIRFSAVCKKWQSIQKEHRIIYSPNPPPLPLCFPWLMCDPYLYRRKSIRFYLHDGRKSYKTPLFTTPRFAYSMVLGHGWLLLHLNTVRFPHSMFIFNPITGVQVELTELSEVALTVSQIRSAHISSAPTDPDCTILIRDHHDIFYFYRLNDNSGLKKVDYSEKNVGESETVFCANKMYNVTLSEIIMVDTLLPDQVERMIEMDCSDILHMETFDVVDFQGDLVIVIMKSYSERKHVYFDYIESDSEDVESDCEDVESDSKNVGSDSKNVGSDSKNVGSYFKVNHDYIDKFHVYKADFSINKWVRMISLGDRALFHSPDIIFSLPAVDAGCMKNTIYSTKCSVNAGFVWKAFNLTTEDCIYGSAEEFPRKQLSWSWFPPTLDYFNVAETNRAC